jgi:hypothetical protein
MFKRTVAALTLGILAVAPALGQSTQPAMTGIEEISELVRLSRPRVVDPEVRERFVQIETIARMSPDDRAAEIPRLYWTLTPKLMNGYVEAVKGFPAKLLSTGSYNPRGDITAIYGAELDQAAATMSSAEVADAIAGAHNSLILRIAARRRAIWVFQQAPDALDQLIQADLAGDDPGGAKRAFDTIREMRLVRHINRVVDLYLGDGPLAASAGEGLTFIHNDPVAARRLIDDIAARPSAVKRHSRLLRSMLSTAPADQVLVKLLDSPDADLHYDAAFSLASCSQDSRVALVGKMVADADPRTRILALEAAFALPDEQFQSLRPALARLLAPRENPRVRATAAEKFANRKYREAIPALIDILSMAEAPIPWPGGYLSAARMAAEPTQSQRETAAANLYLAINRMLGRDTRMISRQWGAPDSPASLALIRDLEKLRDSAP